MLPGGLVTKTVARGAGLAGKVATNVYNSMVRHPYLSMMSEVTGGVGMGAGRGIAEQKLESPLAKTSAEMAGGLAGSMAPHLMLNAPSMIAIRLGKNVLKKISLPFTAQGSKYRAGEGIKSAVTDPSGVAKTLGEETIGDLPPAVQSGQKRIIQLYKSLSGQNPTTDAEAIESITSSIYKLEGEMRKLGYGAPELLAEITEKRIAALELRMDRRIMSASQTAQQKIDKLPVAQRKVAESRIVRNELETAMRTEKKNVDELWQKVPKNIKVGFNKTRSVYAGLLSDLSRAERSDIPDVLKSNPIIKSKKIESTNIKEMQGLRSKLLEVQRKARKEGDWNKARIVGKVSGAILEDIDNVGDQSSSLRAAIQATRHFKDRFESGVVGKILGYDKSGAPAIDPSLTLDISIGRMGTRGSVDIGKVVVSPEAREATQRYLTRSYADNALNPDGTLNVTKSNRWIKSNEAILDQFPELRTQLGDAENAQNIANTAKAALNARKAKLRNPNISYSARFLNAENMNRAVSDVLKNPNPSRYANQLVRQASKDQTGRAIEGLRGGFVAHILEKSTIGSFNEIGERTLSGRAMLNFINKNGSTLKQVFTPEQMTRMNKIAHELAKIDTYKTAKPIGLDELADVASSGLNLFARIAGARIGGWMGRESAGGSLQMAQIFSGSARDFVKRLTKDRALELVNDAVLSKDPRLLKTLLLPLDKPKFRKKNLFELNMQMNLWLLGAGKRVVQETQHRQDSKR